MISYSDFELSLKHSPLKFDSLESVLVFGDREPNHCHD